MSHARDWLNQELSDVHIVFVNNALPEEVGKKRKAGASHTEMQAYKLLLMHIQSNSYPCRHFQLVLLFVAPKQL
jgi:hypothetical protein